MKSWKMKILLPVILVTLLVGGKYILWDFPISTGKRVGNLTKISKKGKFWPFKTWEGTIDEGSGDKLTSYFSVSDDELANELYNYEGKEVIIYYEEYLVGWPRDTKYDVVSWKSKNSTPQMLVDNGYNQAATLTDETEPSSLIDELQKTLFCSFLGSLYSDQDLYQKVKDHVQENNLYLYKQIQRCNE